LHRKNDLGFVVGPGLTRIIRLLQLWVEARHVD
jgi:hypothetical protein